MELQICHINQVVFSKLHTLRCDEEGGPHLVSRSIATLRDLRLLCNGPRCVAFSVCLDASALSAELHSRWSVPVIHASSPCPWNLSLCGNVAFTSCRPLPSRDHGFFSSEAAALCAGSR